MRKLAEIDADIAALEREVRAYEDETRRLKEEITRQRRDGLSAITARRTPLNIELRERRDADALNNQHAWAGKKVTRIKKTGRPWNRKCETLFGVVETVTSKSEFPENLRRPRVGDTIVRLLKKDGTPGLKFEDLRAAPEHAGDNADQYWRLA